MPGRESIISRLSLADNDRRIPSFSSFRMALVGVFSTYSVLKLFKSPASEVASSTLVFDMSKRRTNLHSINSFIVKERYLRYFNKSQKRDILIYLLWEIKSKNLKNECLNFSTFLWTLWISLENLSKRTSEAAQQK